MKFDIIAALFYIAVFETKNKSILKSDGRIVVFDILKIIYIRS
jgi:hypothetical protein